MDEKVWDQVVTLHAVVTRQLAEQMQPHHHIGLSEYQALCRLARADDGELRMQELAELIGLNQSSVSRLVARMARTPSNTAVAGHCRYRVREPGEVARIRRAVVSSRGAGASHRPHCRRRYRHARGPTNRAIYPVLSTQ